LRFEDLFSNNNSLEMNPKDSTEVSKEETKSRDYDSSNLNISEISSEVKSPTNLLSNQKIPYNQKVERGLRLELFICTKDNNHKINKVFDIQVPEFSLEAILTGSSKVTSQNIVDLFKDIQIQNLINDFPKSSTDMICVTNCHAHVTEPSSSKDTSNIKTSIPTESSHISNSEDMISENNKSLLETKVNTPANLTYDRAYFRNKTLDEYFNLYREFSHNDEEIEGRYKAGSYFIKCE
ncbi:1726_t:CDS:2, partial [Racocetra fulgida]